MLRNILLSLCAAALLYGLFRQTPPPQLFNQSDKFGHLSGFAVVTFAGIWALSRKHIPLFIVGLIALACSAEFIQQWLLPHRHFSLYDMYANLTGIAIILMPWLGWRAVRHFFLAPSNLQTSEKHQ
ncbi:hypothetical protein SAMN03080615_04090 [Amphritea atlantica]|uniref:VanZ like family protein n=1 Tax=Amphritea atlantica TaxID=355243 RepID=A0A1H9LU09_9GAMM|nr:hypothetical protein [Amphritea atlantica]SER14739.1 hypothetical protein SAMN03080615_04090 [Amphritea atlantica]